MKNTLTSRPRLSVSIVLYHSPVALLCATLKSLYEASLQALGEGRLESVSVTIIDNSQSEGYAARVCDTLEQADYEGFFSISCIQATRNGGFGHGHNLILPDLTSDYHLILNPDVELAEAALSTGLSMLGSDPGVALVSPRVMGRAGEQEFLCKTYPSVLVLLLRAFAPAFIQAYFKPRLDHYEMRDISRGEQAEDVLLASGCFMLLRSAAFAGLCGFNEKYFLYFEDFDFSLRLRERGRLLFLPTMQVTHHGGYAASKGIRHIGLFIRSGIRFFRDHGWKWI